MNDAIINGLAVNVPFFLSDLMSGERDVLDRAAITFARMGEVVRCKHQDARAQFIVTLPTGEEMSVVYDPDCAIGMNPAWEAMRIDADGYEPVRVDITATSSELRGLIELAAM